jgi:RHS repeat-associated protein
MISYTLAPRAVSTSSLRRLLCILIFSLLIGAAGADAQTSDTDGTTPQYLSPGAPSGSYSLSGFESVNHFNGSFNFSLPLLNVGGRGGVRFPVMLPIEQKWRVEQIAAVQPGGATIFTPLGEWWSDINPRYRAGVLQGRRASYEGNRQYQQYCAVPNDPTTCTSILTQVELQTLTRLTFTAPDGTEYELRDQLTSGQPSTATWRQEQGDMPGFSRGTVFVTFDGSSVTFVSDAAITDYISRPGSGENEHNLFNPSGHLLMPDGTRYRVLNGLVSEIRDRNGNKITYAYNAYNEVGTITDQLNRQVTITYAGDNGNSYDQISFNGFGGTPRTIKVWYDSLQSVLRTNRAGDVATTKSTHDLFPELYQGSSPSATHYNPTNKVSKVELPDGRSYQFRYNVYGELARVELPTGGAMEYDWTPTSGAQSVGKIHRKIVRRRLYKDGGDTPENITEYSGGTESVTNAAGVLLARTVHSFYGSPHEPTGPKAAISYPGWKNGREYRTQVYDVVDGAPVLKQRVEHTWAQRATIWTQEAGNADKQPSNDPRIVETVTTVEPGGANLVAKRTFAYDGFNNQTDVWDYDYGVGAPPTYPTRHSHTDYLTINPVNNVDYTTHTGAHIRNLQRAQQLYAVNPATGVDLPAPVAQSETKYDEYPLLDCDGNGCSGAIQWINPGTSRGNATTARRWLDTNQTWLENRVEYDQLGNVRKTRDARTDKTVAERVTQIEYSADYKHAYPTHTISPVPDLTDTRATSAPLESWSAYDFSTGKLTSNTDANNQTTHLSYKDDNNVPDPLDRPRKVQHPDGGWVRYFYNDTPGNLYVRTDTALNASQTAESYQFFDGLGRGVRSFVNEGGSPVKFITSDTQYDALGRVRRVSNPYRTNGSLDPVNPSGLWTTTAYDALGRVSTTTTPDGAQVSTSYSANEVTVTDQAGIKRKSVTDALGRLRRVIESPDTATCQPDGAGCATNYEYDVLGNLRKVEQGGQLRYFMYDSLGRLIRAKNPEQGNFTPDTDFPALTDATSGTVNSQWSVGYIYDANGNLSKRRDARNITTTYLYDNLRRLIQTSYSDATPATQRTYDKAAQNGRGRLYYDSESSATGTKNYVTEYDVMGRPKAGKTEFYFNGAWQTPYTYSRVYNLMGHVTEQTYPSGHKVYYSQFDAAGRLKKFNGNLGDGTQRTYATGINPANGVEEGIQYDEAGRLSQERFGTQTPLYHKQQFNARGQLKDIRLGLGHDIWSTERGAVTIDYGTTANNGNVVSQQYWIPTDASATAWDVRQTNYAYDSLNRVQGMQEFYGPTGMVAQQWYTYDRWGNRQINAAATSDTLNEKQFAIDPQTNRLGVSAGQLGTMGYDAAGNLTDDTYTGAGARMYDAENRMTSAAVPSITYSASAYTYDANGRRVRRQTPTENVWQIYGLEGELLAEYAANAAPAAPQKEYGYRNGELLITATGGGTNGGGTNGSGTNSVVNDSVFVGQSVPAVMVAGRHYQVSITMKNMGSQTWSSSAGHNLGSQAPQDNYTWGPHRASLPAGTTVNPGSEVTFSFTVTAPATAGTYTFQWRTVQDPVEWFGASSTATSVTVNPAPSVADDSEFVSQSVPTVMQAGQAYNVALRVRNIGTSTWTSSGYGFNLGSYNPYDHQTWGTHRAYLPANVSVAPGDEYTYNFTVTAPATPGTYNFQWRTVHDGVAWFGAYSPNVAVSVTGAALQDGSTFVSQSVPAVMQAGQRYEVSVRMKNTGTSSWTSPNLFNLGSQAPQDNYTWGLHRASLPAWTTVNPGGEVTFSFTVTAPSAAGNYNFQWRTVHDGMAWFGAYSPNVAVSVAGAANTASADVQWLVTDHLGTPRLIADLTGSLAGIKRHDYLPFGEELFAGTGGRTTNQGYSSNDHVRQKFTGHERDAETNLDYMKARYFSSTQGRFTSVDAARIKLKTIADPQDLNRYSYVANNPLKFFDPDGLEKLMVIVRTFIPEKTVKAPGGVSGTPTQPLPGTRTFKGDDRKAGEHSDRFRTQQIITVETSREKNGGKPFISSNARSGPTIELFADGNFKQQANADVSKINGSAIYSMEGSDHITVNATGRASDPLVVGAPNLSYDLSIGLSYGKDGNLTVSVQGTHTEYPGIEVTVIRPETGNSSEQSIKAYNPAEMGRGLFSIYLEDEMSGSKKLETKPKR